MKFTIFSKDGCPYCTKTEQVLQLAKLDYDVQKLNRDYTKEDLYLKFGKGSTFPQVILTEEKSVTETKVIGGCSETVRYLKENNLV